KTPKEEKKFAVDDTPKLTGKPDKWGPSTTPTKMPYYATIPDLQPLLYCDITPTLEKYSVADICFVCDITGSMDTWIKGVKDALKELMASVRNMMSLNPRFGFIGFRDKKDTKQIEKKDFTTNVDEMEQFMSKIVCNGGDDSCEDLVTPLQEALKMDWRSDLQFVFLVVDAPTHGKRYYKKEDLGECDNYENDDKDEMLEKLCCHYRQKKINLVVFKCNNYVDLMIEIMAGYYKSEYSQLQIFDISQNNKELVSKLGISMVAPLTKAFENTIRRNFHKITKARVNDVIDVSQELIEPYTFESTCYSGSYKHEPMYQYMKYDYDIQAKLHKKGKFSISTAELGSGAFNECYLFTCDYNPKEKYVAKIPITPAKKAADLLPDIEGSIFAHLFEQRLTTFTKRPIVRVLPTYIVEVPEGSKSVPIFNGTKYIIAQTYLQGAYKKYNNNYGWVLREDSVSNKLAQAFSHFTYEASLGTLIIVDIQGVQKDDGIFYITDPAIHSVMYKGHFGESNCAKLGLMKFFSTHVCNEYCKDLSLADPRKMTKDNLAIIRARHSGEDALKHLYGNFEKEFEAWQKSLQDFDSKLPPQKVKAPPKPAEGTILLESTFKTDRDTVEKKE
ncbi:MAG: hypothetical protein P4M11_11915, partial [Candidatus Pacebacteria bacterium]|nr:hypothetical protein [Candidatus Paceibacterota bacterium]